MKEREEHHGLIEISLGDGAAMRISGICLSQIDVLTDVNEPELVDSGDGPVDPLSTFLYAQFFGRWERLFFG